MSSKEYEIIEWDGGTGAGTEARRYEDGTIRNELGHWLAKDPRGADNITPELALVYRARAIHSRQVAAMHGVANAINRGRGINKIIGTTEAWAMATEQVADGLFSDKFRDRTDALRVLSDVTPSKYDKTYQPPAQTAPNAAPAQQLAVFLQVVAGRDDDKSTIDAVIVDNSG